MQHGAPGGPVHLATANAYKDVRDSNFPDAATYPENIRSLPIADQIARAATEAAHGAANTLSGQHPVGVWDSANGIEAACSEPVFWDALNADTTALEHGTTTTLLMRAPLWLDGVPERLRDARTTLLRVLLDLSPRWRVWTDWYNAILRGSDHPENRRLIEALEVARILIPDADWAMGPDHINELIERLEFEHRGELPPDSLDAEDQDPAALQFREVDGQVDVDSEAGQQDVARDPVAVDQHAEAARCARVLRERAAGRSESSNSPNDLLPIAERLVAAIGTTLDEVRPGLLIPRAAALTNALQADDARLADESELLGPPLDPTERQALIDAIDACRTWINMDPFLAAMDAARRGGAAIPVNHEEAISLVERAVDEGAATSEACEAIREIRDTAPRSEIFNKAFTNFIRVAAKVASGYRRLAGVAAVTGHAVAVVGWLVRNEDWILSLLEPIPNLRDALRGLIALLKMIPR
jgi:hypothetical protein